MPAGTVFVLLVSSGSGKTTTVQFRAWSRKCRTAIRTAIFDGARMDKLTYAGLKGLGADLSNVTVG